MAQSKDKARNARMRPIMVRVDAPIFKKLEDICEKLGLTPTGYCRMALYEKMNLKK